MAQPYESDEPTDPLDDRAPATARDAAPAARDAAPDAAPTGLDAAPDATSTADASAEDAPIPAPSQPTPDAAPPAAERAAPPDAAPDAPPPAAPAAPPTQLDGDEEPTEAIPSAWKGAAPVPEPSAEERQRRRGVLREPTREMPTVDDPWPAVPPRPANAPVTAPYPPPGPAHLPAANLPARRPPRPPAGPRPPTVGPGRYRGAPPPYWPHPYPPPRRKRRWPWVLAVLAILTLACCGCCYNFVIKPFDEQYPAMVALPDQAAGLVRVTDANTRRETAALEDKIRATQWFAEDVFAVVYADPGSRQRPVTVFGATQFITDPRHDLTTGLDRLSSQLQLGALQTMDPGAPGGHERCGPGRANGVPVSVCAWADHGSLAVGLFVGRDIPESARLLSTLRTALIQRG